MTEITRLVALAFDLVDGALAVGEAVDCASPAVALQTGRGSGNSWGTPAPLHSAAPAISRGEYSTSGTCCAGLGRCRMSTKQKTMANECRIAAMIFGLP
jgi:hypothetical protein